VTEKQTRVSLEQGLLSFTTPHDVVFLVSRIHVNAVGDNGAVLAGHDLGEVELLGADGVKE